MSAPANQSSATSSQATVLQTESHLKVLRLLEANPHLSQRELSEALGVSLGMTNYCLRALLEKGLVKIQNFRNSQNRLAYAYLLTPTGISAKTEMTAKFLRFKIAEYERLKLEIESLQREMSGDAVSDPAKKDVSQ